MFGLKEILYPGRVLNGFWCDSNNKNFDFSNLADILVLLILAIIKIW